MCLYSQRLSVAINGKLALCTSRPRLARGRCITSQQCGEARRLRAQLLARLDQPVGRQWLAVARLQPPQPLLDLAEFVCDALVLRQAGDPVVERRQPIVQAGGAQQVGAHEPHAGETVVQGEDVGGIERGNHQNLLEDLRSLLVGEGAVPTLAIAQ